MRGGGQRPGAKLHTRPGLNLPQSTPPRHEIPSRTPANARPGPVTVPQCSTTVPRTCGRGRAAGPATPTRTHGLHSLRGPDQPGPHKSTRRRPPARPRALLRDSSVRGRKGPRGPRRHFLGAITPLAGIGLRGKAPLRLVPVPSAVRVHTAPALLRCTEPLTAAAGIPQPFPEQPRN